MRAPINSVKHIVQRSLLTIDEQTRAIVNVITVLDAQATTPDHIAVGAVIKAVFLEYWILGESSQPCTTTWIVEKTVSGGIGASQSEMQNLHDYVNKKNILRTGQGVIGDSNTNPIPVIREWIKIPKGKQRFGLGDALRFTVSCIGEANNGLEICGNAIYKEYQ